MSRSWSLTRGHRGRIFRVISVVFVLMTLPIMALGGFATTRAGPEGFAGTEGLAFSAVASLLSALIQPLLYCALTVAYYDLRVRKEAYDLELRAASMAGT
jgi:hypothetical protein